MSLSPSPARACSLRHDLPVEVLGEISLYNVVGITPDVVYDLLLAAGLRHAAF